MARKVPERTPEQQQEAERRRMLLHLDIPAIRTWMRQTGLEEALISDNDALVLRAAHETRAIDPRMPCYVQRESIRWLREHHPESEALKTIATYPGEFRGR